MKITCRNCRTQYSFADERVRGKLVRVRCKRCFTTNIAYCARVPQQDAPQQQLPMIATDKQAA
jgi:predicted Zn finger-like uncharacterized protein